MAIPSIGLSSKATNVAWACFQIMTSEYKISEKSTCGVLGNVYVESAGFQTSVEEFSGGGGWGLFQLTGPRRTAGQGWCNDHGYKDASELEKIALQLKYVFEIEKGGYTDGGTALSHLKKYKSVEEACHGWCYGWERPGVPHYENRLNFANKMYNAWEGKGGEGVKGLDNMTFGGDGEDEGPEYVSFEEALIEGFKGGKKEKPQGIAIHEILGYKSAKSAKDALHKKQTIGQAGAQFHIVCDAKDAYMVVDLEKRVSHVQRANGKNKTGISNPNSKVISIGMCGSSGAVMGKAAQVAAEVCHLLDLDASSVNGSFKFDGVADPASWKEQEDNSIIGDEGNFINMVMQQGTAAAGAQDIGGIMSSTGESGGGGGGRGSTKKVIEIAEKWHKMNDQGHYSSPGKTGKGPFGGGFDCSGFVMSTIRGAGYNIGHLATPGMLQNCKPLDGADNSDQCRGGKNAFFKQIKPSEARKGDVLVAGGLGGSGAGGHTGFVWESYHGKETKFLNSGGCSAEGSKQPNLSSIGCAMGTMGQWVFMTINSKDSDEEIEDSDKKESKSKENEKKVVKKK